MKTPINSLQLEKFICEGNNYAIAMKECNYWHYSVNANHYKTETMVAHAITFARSLSENDTLWYARDAANNWYYFVSDSEESLLLNLRSLA